jgi:hypothetical protein
MVRAVLVVTRNPAQPNKLDACRDVLNRLLSLDAATPPGLLQPAVGA